MKLVTVVGARPQFIKSGPVSLAIEKHNRENGVTIEEILVHTGQHYDSEMSQVFFEEMNLRTPKYNLEVGSGNHGEQTAQILARCEKVLMDEKATALMVYGDTNSTLAAALAAVKLHIPVFHVEAGLRSFVREMPEEVNRVLTDHISDLLFAPTDTAVENLKAEGITKGVELLGDVMYDAIQQHLQTAKMSSSILNTLALTPGGYALMTMHRASNTDDPALLGQILSAISEIAKNIRVVWPVHPRARKRMEDFGIHAEGITLISPASYLDMMMLVSNASLVLTDSGGLQKEACWMRVPCVTLRDETEWVETVASGWNTLAGADRDQILMAARKALTSKPSETPGAQHAGASERIAASIRDYMTKRG
ncbi:UDP-N-acetylglucosamine 2-epimerase [Candidatus Koribacter versatilis Ellin345]|uniref:UDP-N-acetylglucosamine 2-epimerase n=1 Tax=Koribacter versatilis (strain Ellin345) TaxID=204669 RepID=Q1ILE3_KORVE|nr:UDP-N-acetylglucosamine 2-epimerase (non-hydrolyzing) [Candidatus Koribacter versatilis]ABF42307.1 UDP-N-acetylglucosamine 2-epimerase [Candidatus Koribacter versatilis Ellin345]